MEVLGDCVYIGMEIVVYFGMENAIVPPLVSLNPDGMITYSNTGKMHFST